MSPAPCATSGLRGLIVATALLSVHPGPASAQDPPASPLRHGAVTGSVVGPDGTPAAGAEVVLVPVLMSAMSASDLGATRWLATQRGPDLVERNSADAEGRIAVTPSPPAADARLGGVYAGVEWMVFVLAPKCRPHVVEFAASAGAKLDLGHIVLEPGAGLCGRVLDDKGRPLAGADVSLSADWPNGRFAYRGSLTDDRALRQTTDSDGRFTFPAVFEGPLELHVEHIEASRALELPLAAPAIGKLVDLGPLVMPRGGRIGGRLVGREGQPLAGACIYAADGSLGFDPKEAQDPVATARSAVSRRPVFTTDAEGRFSITGVPGPSAHLLVLAPGHDGVLLPCVRAGKDDFEFALQPEGRLSLIVTDATTDEAVTNAEVLALRSSGSVSSGTPHALPVTRRGNGDELVYEIGQVGPALTAVQVTAPGFAPAWIECDGVAAGGHRAVPVGLRPAAVLEGIVTDADGQPLEGVTVSAINVQAMFRSDHLTSYVPTAAAPVRAREHAAAISGADGRYTFTELTPGMWSFEAQLDTVGSGEDAMTSLAYGSTRATKMRLVPKPTEDARVVPPEANITLRGQVLSGGRPVPGAAVWLERQGSGSLLRRPGSLPFELGFEGTDYPDREADTLVDVAADGDGRFAARVQHAGTWRLCAASPQGGVLLAPQTIVVEPKGETSADSGVVGGVSINRDIPLGEARLEIRVLAQQDGSPIEGCWVWIDPGVIYALTRNTWRTDAEGRVLLEHLMPGTYTVTSCVHVSFSDGDEPRRDAVGTSATVTIGDVAASVVTAELRLPRASSVEGIAHAPDGTQVPDGTLVFCERKGRRELQSQTRDGRFMITGLDAGDWEVFVTASGNGYAAKDRLGTASVEVGDGVTASCELEVRYPSSKPYRRELTREEYYAPTSFDSAKWQDRELVEEGVRIRMIDDLLAKHELVGLTRDEVIGLLGPPDKRFTEEPKLTWYLGDERSAFAIDSEWLSLTFGEGDRVVEKSVWAD